MGIVRLFLPVEGGVVDAAGSVRVFVVGVDDIEDDADDMDDVEGVNDEEAGLGWVGICSRLGLSDVVY